MTNLRDELLTVLLESSDYDELYKRAMELVERDGKEDDEQIKMPRDVAMFVIDVTETAYSEGMIGSATKGYAETYNAIKSQHPDLSLERLPEPKSQTP